MAKYSPEGETRRDAAPRSPAPPSGGPPPYATLVGVGLLLAVSVFNWRDGVQFQKNVTAKLDALSTSVGQLSGKVDAVAKGAAQPPRPSGPDPNKVYTVKTQGAPILGSPAAPIVIAEFSDFQ